MSRDLRGLVQNASPDVWLSVLEEAHPKAELLLPAVIQQEEAQSAGLHKDLKAGSNLVRYDSCCAGRSRMVLLSDESAAAVHHARHLQVWGQSVFCRKATLKVPHHQQSFSPDNQWLGLILARADAMLDIRLVDVKSGCAAAWSAVAPVSTAEHTPLFLQWTADSQYCLATVHGVFHGHPDLPIDHVLCLGRDHEARLAVCWLALGGWHEQCFHAQHML